MKNPVILLFVFFLVFSGWGFQINAQEELPLLKDVGINQQYQETMKDMIFLSGPLLDYVEHFNKAPQANTFKELLKMDCGNGLTVAEFLFDEIPEEQIPLKDVWENDFLYKYQENRFWIGSPGSDGKFGGFEQIGAYLTDKSHMQGKDIILSNSRFVLFPIEMNEFASFFRLFLTVFSNFR